MVYSTCIRSYTLQWYTQSDFSFFVERRKEAGEFFFKALNLWVCGCELDDPGFRGFNVVGRCESTSFV